MITPMFFIIIIICIRVSVYLECFSSINLHNGNEIIWCSQEDVIWFVFGIIVVLLGKSQTYRYNCTQKTHAEILLKNCSNNFLSDDENIWYSASYHKLYKEIRTSHTHYLLKCVDFSILLAFCSLLQSLSFRCRYDKSIFKW